MKNTFNLITIILTLIIIGENNFCAQKNNSKDFLIKVSIQDIGTVNTFMNFEFQDSTFNAFTRQNVCKDILGLKTTLLGKVFSNYFKKGSLMHLDQGSYKVVNGTLKMTAVLVSAVGSYYFDGEILNEKLYGTLKDINKVKIGEIKGRLSELKFPIDNYVSLNDSIFKLTNNFIYDPSILNSQHWSKFKKKMRKVSYKVNDDLEMIFAFYHHSKKLPFSHYYLYKTLDVNDIKEEVTFESQIELYERLDNTAIMKIHSFSGSSSEVDSIMGVILKKGYKNLIIDLRSNTGGTIEAGLSLVTQIVDTSFYGGIFLTQKWFNEFNKLPEIKDYKSFPHFTEANFNLIINGIHSEKALCLKVNPQKNNYKGKLFVLTDKYTASTCEPIVYLLKKHNRATIIGEKTAGAMLNGEHFDIKSGFSLVIPTATYYTSDGYKIDQKGVLPDFRTNSKDALNHVLDVLIH